MREHGLRLVIRGVRHRHLVYTSVLHQARKKLVTRSSRRILYIGFVAPRLSRDIGAPRMKSQTIFFGQLRREFFIRVGISTAQFVIEMHNAEHDSQLLPQLHELQQQRHRIGAPGYRHSHALTGAHERLLFNCALDAAD